MAEYFKAPSLDQLVDEVDAAYPDRDKASDGWIGDPSHQARVSDHNPDYSAGGVVRAVDIDVDGVNINNVLAHTTNDWRVSYVIYNRRIWGGTRWRLYEGSNPHTKHIHVSIEHNNAAEDSRQSWGIAKNTPPARPKKKKKAQSANHRPDGSTTFPTDYEDLAVKGEWDVLRQGAVQILMHQLGYRTNKQWDGKAGSLTYRDLMNWLQDLGYYVETPVAKWGVKKGVPLKVDGKPGKWFWYEFQHYLKDRKYYKGILDGDPKAMTFEAIERWLNKNNSL